MDLIEQAVFTSAETDRAAGYQVVATSPGVCEADVRELAVWGPSHDALLEPTPDAVSLNFHPLPSGSYCVSRTSPAGWEYSGRGGARVYTQCLIVSPASLARFANNPFALSRAALAAGLLRLHDEVPKRLAPLRLAGRAPVCDSTVLARLCANPGPDWLASLVQAALTSTALAIAGGPPAEQVIAGLLNCLPPECRLQFSFSTGLKFSSRRPFRVIAVSQDPEERRRVERLYDMAVLDFSDRLPAEFEPVESWARFIQRVLKSGRTSLLSSRLSRRQCDFSPEDLPALGLQLLEELDASSFEHDPDDDGSPIGGAFACPTEWAGGEVSWEYLWTGQAPGEGISGGDAEATPALGGLSADPARDAGSTPQAAPLSELFRGAHEAHSRFHKDSFRSAARPFSGASSCPSDGRPSGPAPSQLLDPNDPEVLEKLEHLDDLVYDAVEGKAVAMDELRTFWPRVRDELGDHLLAESQEQYLRYALSAWVGCMGTDTVRDPSRAIQSLEVLCVLFDEV